MNMAAHKQAKTMHISANIFIMLLVAQAQSTYERCRYEDANHVINVNVNGGRNSTADGAISKLQADVTALKNRVSQMEYRWLDDRGWLANETQRIEVHRSCNGWHLAGMNKTGFLMVDPDGKEGVRPFLAYCNMSNNIPGHGIPTEVHHDSSGKTEINSKCQPAQCYTREVNYMATKSQIEALLHASRTCSQLIRYDCKNSVLFHVTNHYAAWYSRDGQQMSYWGGALPGTGKCACGMSNSCAKPNKRCNCDANDNVWRADYGYLTDKHTIPVSMMKFGDLDQPNERAFFTLGPLICY